MAKTITVEVDSREQNPLLFPDHVMWCPQPYKPTVVRIKTAKVTLPFGDYRIASHPDCCVVERKGSFDELCTNLLSADRARFNNAFQRLLDGCRYPTLLVEDNPSRHWVPKGTGKMTDSDLFCSLWGLVLGTPRLTPLFVGRVLSPATRRNLGGQMVRLMLAATLLPTTPTATLPQPQKEAA